VIAFTVAATILHADTRHQNALLPDDSLSDQHYDSCPDANHPYFAPFFLFKPLKLCVPLGVSMLGEADLSFVMPAGGSYPQGSCSAFSRRRSTDHAGIEWLVLDSFITKGHPLRICHSMATRILD
jgi:hypothetical protein